METAPGIAAVFMGLLDTMVIRLSFSRHQVTFCSEVCCSLHQDIHLKLRFSCEVKIGETCSELA